MLKKIFGKHSYLVVVIQCFLIAICTVGFSTAGSLYTEDFCRQLNMSMSMNSLINIICGIIASVSSAIIVRIINRNKLKQVFITGFVFMVLSGWGMPRCNSIILYGLMHLIRSVGLMCFNGTIIILIINNWFENRRTFLVGIVMTSTGLGGGIISPVISKMTAGFGYGKSYLLYSILSVITIIPALVLLPLKPKNIGMNKYRFMEDKQKQTVELNAPYSVKSSLFIKTVLFGCFVILIANIYSFLSRLIHSMGYDTSIGARVLSFCMYGNFTSKLLLSLFGDKLGIRRSLTGLIAIATTAMVMMLFVIKGTVALCICGFFYGFIHSVSSVGIPVYVTYIFGKDNYPEVFTKVALVDSIVNYLLSFVVSLIYDVSSSYVISFAIACGFGVLAIIMTAVLEKSAIKEINRNTVNE